MKIILELRRDRLFSVLCIIFSMLLLITGLSYAGSKKRLVSRGVASDIDVQILDIGPINSPADDVTPSLGQEGQYIAFASNREGGAGGWDIYLFDRSTLRFVPLPRLNTKYDEKNPSISRNAEFIVFDSNREDRHKEYDIYLYDVKNNRLVEDLQINTPRASESHPTITLDGKYITFLQSDTGPKFFRGPDRIKVYNVNTRKSKMLDIKDESTFTNYGQFFPEMRDDLHITFLWIRKGEKRRDKRHSSYWIAEKKDVNGSDIWLRLKAPNFIQFHYNSFGKMSLSEGGRLFAFAGHSDPWDHYSIRIYDSEKEKTYFIDKLSGKFDNINPSLSPEGKYIGFSSNRPDGTGGWDLYLAELPLCVWTFDVECQTP